MDTAGVDRDRQSRCALVRARRAAARHLVRTTLATLEVELDPAHFARVHRSAIVRLDCVRELRVLPGVDVRAVLSDGTVVPVSERYRARLRAFFSGSM